MLTSKHDRVYQTLANIFLVLLVIVIVLPFILLFMSSITEEGTLVKNGYTLFPEKFSLEAYRYIFVNSNKIFKAYAITVGVTAVGTALHILLSSMLAYPLSLKKLPGRNFFSFYVFFTMLFNGGLVPTYMMYTGTFHIKNSIFALVVPGFLMSAMNVLLIRTYFSNNIPEALYEAAEVDGAGHFTIFTRIVLPLGKPILVTVGLFAGLGYWNDWKNGLYYITETELFSVQNMLNNMLQDVRFLASGGAGGNASEIAANMPSVGIKMAIAVVGALPVMVIYPFFQQYFVKGITIGAVKG